MKQRSGVAVVLLAMSRSRDEVFAIAANLLKCGPVDLELCGAESNGIRFLSCWKPEIFDPNLSRT